MKPSAAIEANQVAVRELVRRFKTENPRVFGSVLHGKDKEGSDLDLLVDPLPGVTLFDLGGLQVELEELLEDLPTKYRQKVLLEALPV